MQTTITTTFITFDTLDVHGGLFTALLRARWRHFVDAREWDLPHVRGMEFDQYDTPLSTYVAIHDGPEILVGYRVIPTTARCFGNSYMVRDAQMGLLPSLPSDLLDTPAPCDPHIFELTRLFSTDGVDRRKNTIAQALFIKSLGDLAEKLDIDEYIAITSEAVRRHARRLSVDLQPAGPLFDAAGELCRTYRFKAPRPAKQAAVA